MSAKPVRILIAEDDPTSAFILEAILKREGHEVLTVSDGEMALHALKKYQFSAILTDWMMPKMDGLELIRQVRLHVKPVPAILMITSISMSSAVEHSLQSGADDYIVKPYMPNDVLSALNKLLAIQEETESAIPITLPTVVKEYENTISTTSVKDSFQTQQQVPSVTAPRALPALLGVAIVTNTGGPNALSRFFQELPNTDQMVFLVILQTPTWALEMFAMRLQKMTPLKVVLAEDGMSLTGGTIYIARKDRHMVVTPNCKIHYEDTPEVNHARPSADVLLKSLAEVFGAKAIGIGLTGIGRDGLTGMASVAAVGGKVVAQDPSTADAPYFPQALLALKIDAKMASLPNLAKGLIQIAEKQAELTP